VNQHTIALVFAHPDDESFGSACTIYRAVQDGNKAVLLVATPGDAGKSGRLGPMTKEELAVKRKQELNAAADIIGLSVVKHLNYADGQLQKVGRSQLVEDVIAFLNEQKAQVVITFPEDGVSGHSDHTAIHHATRQAVDSGRCPLVQKLYYYPSTPLKDAGHSPTVKWDITSYWQIKAAALLSHESQILSIERVFGDLLGASYCIPDDRRYEAFVLAWERGNWWPAKQEIFITDGLKDDS
jgi:LmbE family N-acetylglucosaminyl deacetylase